MALSCGADLVIELPSAFATGSAEDFAACGVSLLDHTGITDVLCFGSESGDLPSLQATAEFLCRESSDFQDILRSRLKQGLSIPCRQGSSFKRGSLQRKNRHPAFPTSGKHPLKSRQRPIPPFSPLPTIFLPLNI